MKRVAAAQPLVLVLDDLHAADEPSLLLLQFVARELAQSRIVIVGACRDVDPTPADPLKATLAELAREPVTRTLPLAGLGEAGRRAASSRSRHPRSRPAELGAAVYAETEGNPLFVGEIVRLLGREGQLAEAPLAIPHSVRETIGRRLRHLSDESNDLLTLASVLGREFDLHALARVSGLERGAVLELLDEATEARVVSEVPGAISRMRFAHALIRDAAYHRLTRARRIELHRRVGEALEAIHAAELDPHLAELAHHFYEAAAATRRVDYARRAGARAVAQLAYEEAVRLYELALAALDAGGAATAAERCELLLALGDAQGRRGDDAGAKTTFLQAADVARAAGFGRADRPRRRRLRRTLPVDARAHRRAPRPAPRGRARRRRDGRQRAARPAALTPGRGAAPRPDALAPRAADGGGDPDGAPDRRPDHDRVRADRRRVRAARAAHRPPSAWPTRARSSRSRPPPATASGSSTATSTRSGPPGSSVTPTAARASWRR